MSNTQRLTRQNFERGLGCARRLVIYRVAFTLLGRVHEPVITGCICLVNDSRDRRNFAVFVTKFALYSLDLSTALLMIQEIDGTSLYVTKLRWFLGIAPGIG